MSIQQFIATNAAVLIVLSPVSCSKSPDKPAAREPQVHQMATSIVGIGIALYKHKEKGPAVVGAVVPGSPAGKSGSIKPGFIILSIDGTSTTDKSLAECVQLIRGAPETPVTLELVDPVLHQTNTVTLNRATIQLTDSPAKR